MSAPQKPLANIGILSIGDMGVGVAKLLVTKGFAVSTNVTGRSQETQDRAKSANVHTLASDAALVAACDVILSIVPPRDAEATARRVVEALASGARETAAAPLFYADMNAVAPSTARKIAALFKPLPPGAVRFVDGGIIGGPPSPPSSSEDGGAEWFVPLMPMSGPHELSSAAGFGPALASALHARHVGDGVGAASGLKMCFASMAKGYIAIAIQAFTTAHRLGVVGELQHALQTIVPGQVARTQNGLVGMAPKAYRWVREMEEIGAAFREDGGFGGAMDMFGGAAEIYRAVAEDTVLGEEKIGARKRGRTAEEVAAAVAEGLERKRKKTE